jgi:hypothetical protein
MDLEVEIYSITDAEMEEEHANDGFFCAYKRILRQFSEARPNTEVVHSKRIQIIGPDGISFSHGQALFYREP